MASSLGKKVLEKVQIMKVKPCAHEVVEVVVITFSQSLTLAKYSTSLASLLKLASEMFVYFFSFFEQVWTRPGH